MSARPPAPTPVYLTRKNTIERIRKFVQMSPSTFDRMRHDADFPRPYKLRPTVRTEFWLQTEIDDHFTSAPRAA